MELLLIRHADAAPMNEAGVDDDADRPLTSLGKEQCKVLSLALQRLGVHIDSVTSSPLLRAQQTATELVAEWAAPQPPVDVCEALAPGAKHRKLERYLLKASSGSAVLVGHMPDLGEFAAWLIGNKNVQINFAKAGAALIKFDALPAKGTGTLAWLVTPAWCQAVVAK
jgi:phosphohistidine phosphatase